MAIGDYVAQQTVTASIQATVAWNCLVDGTALSAGPGALKAGASSFFAFTCPTCHTRYLINGYAPALSVTVQQTS